MTGFLSNIWVLFVAVVATLFVSCSDGLVYDDVPENEGDMVSTFIHLKMKVSGDSFANGSRAGGTALTQDETPGYKNEDAINTVDLLIYDANSGEMIALYSLDKKQIAEVQTKEGAFLPVVVNKGKTVRIYAAVNISQSMRRRFLFGSGLDMSFTAPDSENDYWKVINDIIPNSDGKQETLEKQADGGIPMTGQFVTDESPVAGDITIGDEHLTKETALRATADIRRIVAKVHVLAKTADDSTDGSTPRYVRAFKDPTQGSAGENLENLFGWVRIENVRYIPNGTNRSTYIFPQANTGDGYALKDLNMNLDSYIVGGKLNGGLWRRDFDLLDGNDKQNANLQLRMSQAEVYDAERLAKTKGTYDPDRYVKGMYCLENYFDQPEDIASFEDIDGVIPMVTHVSIAAKMVPRVIHVETDFLEKMNEFVRLYSENQILFLEKYNLTKEDFTDADKLYWENNIKSYFVNPVQNYGFLEIALKNEDEVRFILNCSLKINGTWSSDPLDFEDGKYSDGTFYVYDRKYDENVFGGERFLCLTARAVSTATGDNYSIHTRAVPHIGGWSYYYTYIDNDHSTVDGKTPYTASQVTRNTYYIITIDNIGNPGGSTSNPEHIRVNTDALTWDYTGKGDIFLH